MKYIKERNIAVEYLNKDIIATTKLSKNEINKAVDTLVDAFNGYRMLNWMHMDKLTEEKLKLFFSIELNTCNETSIFLSDSKNYECIAILQPCTNASASFTGYVAGGGLNLVKYNGVKCVKRMLDYSDYITKYRTKLVGSQPWYLYYLGTKVNQQGKGLGTKIMNKIIDYMDYSHNDLYIETNELENVDYYKKFGFKLIDEYNCADFKGYCLLRKAS